MSLVASLCAGQITFLAGIDATETAVREVFHVALLSIYLNCVLLDNGGMLIVGGVAGSDFGIFRGSLIFSARLG